MPQDSFEQDLGPFLRGAIDAQEAAIRTDGFALRPRERAGAGGRDVPQRTPEPSHAARAVGPQAHEAPPLSRVEQVGEESRVRVGGQGLSSLSGTGSTMTRTGPRRLSVESSCRHSTQSTSCK